MWLKSNGLNQFMPPGYTLHIRETLQYCHLLHVSHLVMTSRLASIAPDIENTLATLPQSRRTTIALEAALWAIKKLDADSEETSSLITSNDPALAESFARHYDALYFETEDSSPSDSFRYFCLARATSSLAFALTANDSEAIYEAIIATDDVLSIREMLNS